MQRGQLVRFFLNLFCGLLRLVFPSLFYGLRFTPIPDVDAARRLWAAKDYVDPKRVGIWGWVSLESI